MTLESILFNFFTKRKKNRLLNILLYDMIDPIVFRSSDPKVMVEFILKKPVTCTSVAVGFDPLRLSERR